VTRFVCSDAELAFLLAHEIAHVLLEHDRHGYEAAIPLTRLAGSVDARLIDENPASNLTLRLQFQPLLRAQQDEADRLGAELAGAAGFTASAGVGPLARMGRPRRSAAAHPRLTAGAQRRASLAASARLKAPRRALRPSSVASTAPATMHRRGVEHRRCRSH
jgi:predicted Zn-dependent protease